MNLTESKKLDNGYKFVWEFTPSQGNGTIAAAALTSAQGGANAYGSLVNDSSTFLQIKSIKLDGMAMARELVLFETVEVDFERNLLLFHHISGYRGAYTEGDISRFLRWG